jgi:hypothetical protein
MNQTLSIHSTCSENESNSQYTQCVLTNLTHTVHVTLSAENVDQPTVIMIFLKTSLDVQNADENLRTSVRARLQK